MLMIDSAPDLRRVLQGDLAAYKTGKAEAPDHALDTVVLPCRPH